VEAVTVSPVALLAWTVNDPLVLSASLVFAVAGTALAFIDGAVRRHPDRLTVPAFTAAATLLAVDATWHRRLADGLGALGGAVANAGFCLMLAFLADGGLGDVQLALGTGLLLGWHGWAAVLLGVTAGFALTALFVAAMVLAGRLKRGEHLAHGPGGPPRCRAGWPAPSEPGAAHRRPRRARRGGARCGAPRSAANRATVCGRRAARAGSISTACTCAGAGSRARVSDPSPGPTSSTTSSGPTAAVRTIRRTVLGSWTKFCPDEGTPSVRAGGSFRLRQPLGRIGAAVA
jgi:hypothetical protein